MALAWIFAAALTGAAAPPGGHVTTNPDWLKKPTAQELYDAWPAEAYRKGVGGKALIACRVSVAGLADSCKVVSETPAGMGFGAAAVLLAHTFLFKPGTVDGTPVPGEVKIPINFTGAPAGGASGREVLILGQPIFAAAPTWGDLAGAYPTKARGKALYFAFRCDVTRAGELHSCDLKQSDSSVEGGEAAAKRLVGKFRIDARQLPDKRAAPLRADVSIRLIDPDSDAFKSRRIGQPQWVTVADPNKVVAMFPPEAIAKGVQSGLGVAHCTVAADGALTTCAPARSDPPGYGFETAAVRVASIMRMSIWTPGGSPVDGAVIDVPIRFKLKAEPMAGQSAPPDPAPRPQ